MTAEPTPQAPLLTAEEEARWRAYAYEMRAQPEGEKMLRLFAILDAVRRDRNAWRAQSDRQVADIAALISQLDAARAETEAVRALAAELVEGLAGMVMRYGDFAPGEPFLFPPNHHIDLARALIARARALGIGGERPHA